MDYITRAKKFRAKKRLGQNFLVDENIISAILEHSEISPNETVVEIGPGLGFVTEQLVQYAKKYPQYGYEKHKGYPTPEHKKICRQIGPSPIQRLSFKY